MMQIPRNGLRSLLLAALLCCAAAPSAHAEADHGAIARAALSEVVRPGYAELARSAAALDGKVDALCEAPSAAGLDAAKEAFVATVMSWSRVEIFRFGPVIKDHRYARLFYWPDPKGIGLRQVQRVIAEKNETVVDHDDHSFFSFIIHRRLSAFCGMNAFGGNRFEDRFAIGLRLKAFSGIRFEA